jgi:protein TonB
VIVTTPASGRPRGASCAFVPEAVMSHELFHDVTDVRPRAGRATGGTLAVSIVAHAAILAAVVVVPLLATDTLPKVIDTVGPYVPVATPPQPPRGPEPTRTPSAKTNVTRNPAPIDVPDAIHPEVERSPATDYSIADVISTPAGGFPGVVGGADDGVPSPPPPPPPAPPKPIRATSVNMPTKVHDVAPIYPAIAQRASLEGVVIVEAVIAVDGSVRDARVLKSVPLLDGAALDAVKQWRYAPTRVNGVAVPVIVTVTVQFRLQR